MASNLLLRGLGPKTAHAACDLSTPEPSSGAYRRASGTFIPSPFREPDTSAPDYPVESDITITVFCSKSNAMQSC